MRQVHSRPCPAEGETEARACSEAKVGLEAPRSTPRACAPVPAPCSGPRRGHLLPQPQGALVVIWEIYARGSWIIPFHCHLTVPQGWLCSNLLTLFTCRRALEFLPKVWLLLFCVQEHK